MSLPRIDYNALGELEEILEDEFVELIETYISDTQAKILLLIQGVTEQNSDSVRKVAHSVKGASVNLGVQQLGHICHIIEEAASQGDLDQAVQSLDEVQAEAESVINELSAKFL